MTRALALALTLVVVALSARAAAEPPRGYGVDHDRSYVLAVVDTAGLLGALGHEHSVLATDGSALVCYSRASPQLSSVRFTIPTASLRIDTPRARSLAGLDGEPPSDDDRHDMQQKMLSERFLWADRHDELRFESTKVEGAGDGYLRITGDFTIRGQKKRVELPVRVEERDGTLFMTGTVTVRQTDFGMEPEDIAGVVKVADAVDIRFHVFANEENGEAACA